MRAVWALRSALFVAWLVLTVIPWALAVLLISVFARGAPVYWSCVGWLRTAIWGARVICGVRWRVQGMENVPSAADARSAVLLASKHQSTWETFAYPMLMPHPLAYVFKRELLYIPFFGWAMARMDMIHIDRSRRTEAWNKVAAQGKRLFGQGIWVIMFPEGTRAARGTLTEPGCVCCQLWLVRSSNWFCISTPMRRKNKPSPTIYHECSPLVQGKVDGRRSGEGRGPEQKTTPEGHLKD